MTTMNDLERLVKACNQSAHAGHLVGTTVREGAHVCTTKFVNLCMNNFLFQILTSLGLTAKFRVLTITLDVVELPHRSGVRCLHYSLEHQTSGQ